MCFRILNWDKTTIFYISNHRKTLPYYSLSLFLVLPNVSASYDDIYPSNGPFGSSCSFYCMIYVPFENI